MPNTSVDYKTVIDFMVSSGKRLVTRAGKIKDIGITKKDLTEEDLAIERGLKEIIIGFGGNPVVYAEEENDIFNQSDDLWVIDPISGTHRFIKGESHYSIVVCHLINHKAVFAAVYDPSVEELYTAYVGKGAFLNNSPIHVSKQSSKIIIRPSMFWKDPDAVSRLENLLQEKALENNSYSMAVNYCKVAKGEVDGVVALTKDSFTEFDGKLIIAEAGGRFTNINGTDDIQPTDRVFVGGNIKIYAELLPLARQALLLEPIDQT
jgi:myo-inositol-1(or 4)-monophosphatase